MEQVRADIAAHGAGAHDGDTFLHPTFLPDRSGDFNEIEGLGK
jgi:hypothetical protein